MSEVLPGFAFRRASTLEIYIFFVFVLYFLGMLLYKMFKYYVWDKKKFKWIYDLAKTKDFTKTEIQDLKEISVENGVKSTEQLYRIISSVRMLSSTRRKLYKIARDGNIPGRRIMEPIRH